MKCAFCWILAIGLSFNGKLAANEALGPQETAASQTKEQVLDKWAEALGGRENLQNVRTIHLRGTFESGGLKGTYERWTTSSGEFRTSVDLSGAFRQTNVFNGHAAWTLDTSGTVHEISGEVLKGLVSAAYEASNSFLFSGRIPGEVDPASMDFEDAAYILRLEAEGGSPLTVYLDAKTFLPKREESSGPMGKRVIRFSDWRVFGGIRIPGEVRQSTGDPRFDAIVTIEQVETNAALAPELFEKPSRTAEPIRFANGAHEAALPAEVYGDHIFVPVRVNEGKAAWFFLDSGAGFSVVSKPLADRARLRVLGNLRGRGTGGGSAGLGLAQDVTFDLGEVSTQPSAVAVWDLSTLLPAVGHRWDGLIGFDVLSRVVVRVDYEHGQVTFADPNTFVAPPNVAMLPVKFLGNLPVVRGAILLQEHNPIETDLAIDSGADGLHLTTPFVRQNDVMKAISNRIASSATGAGGTSSMWNGRLSGIQLGRYLLKGPVAGFSDSEKQGLLASPDIGALVGGEILKRFNITFDFPHNRVLVEPNAFFTSPFSTNESGLGLLAEGLDFHDFLVDTVEPRSPAAKAGLRKGDVLLKINDYRAEDLDLAKVYELLQPGPALRLVVRRGGKTIHVSLLIKELL